MRELFEYIKSLLGDKYDVVLQNVLSDTPGSLGLFFFQGAADEETLDGQQVYEVFDIHLQLICDKTEESIYEGLDYLRDMVDLLENEAAGTGNIEIVSIQRKGAKAAPIGFNDLGFPEVVSNLQLLYVINTSDEAEEDAAEAEDTQD